MSGWERPSDDWLVWLYGQLSSQFSEDIAGDTVARLLTAQPKGDHAALYRYAQRAAGRIRREQANPIRVTIAGRTHREPVLEVSADLIMMAQARRGRMNPEELLLAKERFLLRHKMSPQQVRAVIFGGPRMAECHPERRHKALGLCGPCYQVERRAG